jgi:hypothetical protein
MSIFDDIFGTSAYDADAGRARKATVQAAGQGAAAQKGALKKSVGLQREALAPAITSAGDYLQQQQGGYGDYSSLLRSAYGVDDPAAASAAYGRSLNPAREQTNQSLLRLTPQGVGSGRAMTDLANYEFGNYYDKWLPGIVGQQKQFDPYQAIVEQGNLGSNLANIEGAFGTNLANVYGNKFNTIGQANAGYQNQLAANRSTAAGNLSQGIQWLGNTAASLAGASMNPSPTSKLPQYASSTGSGSTFPGWAMG